MNLTLKVWRQRDAQSQGRFRRPTRPKMSSADMSFLEMLDVVNEELIAGARNRSPSIPIAARASAALAPWSSTAARTGDSTGTTACQLHMRHFQDGQTILIEPWRARPFPVLKDLITDRSAFDRIIQAGGFVSVNTGGAPDGNALPIAKTAAEQAMDAAACIGCGACVAACKNASAMLFVAAKVSHLATLPQGKAERERRVLNMVRTMDEAGFGNCTVTGSCEAVCPKEISLDFIAQMNREYGKAILRNSTARKSKGGD